MIGDLLDKIVSDGRDTIDKLKEVAPFIVIGVLWLLGAIAKTVQSGKKGKRPEIQQMTKDKQRQPKNLGDFIKIVKEHYAAAREQVMKSAEQSSSMEQRSSWPETGAVTKPPMLEVTTAAPPVVEKPPPVLEPVSAASIKKTALYEEKSPAGSISYLTELAEQYKDKDGLRKAILHYEILGKPVGLR